MPLYRRWQARDGYESVSNGIGNVLQTHVFVWESQNGAIPAKHVVHHRNHIHFDNRPSNLELMAANEHSAYHRRTGHSLDNSDPLFQLLRRAGVARRSSDSSKRQRMSDVGAKNIKKYMQERPEQFKRAVADNGQRGARYLRRFNTVPRSCDICGREERNSAALRWHKHREHGFNHKVLITESREEFADVYCLSVDRHHNFALAAGVFVHNCGMVAVQTTLTAADLPDSLRALRADIERSVPVGFDLHPRPVLERRHFAEADWLRGRIEALRARFDSLAIVRDLGRLDRQRVWNQIGTLGGGNHFIELCIDEKDRVWLMLHSGSRNIGNRIGEVAIATARRLAERDDIHLPDRDLAWLSEGSPEFDRSIAGLRFAQDYAALNRDVMLDLVMAALGRTLPRRDIAVRESAVNCHHNYADVEEHFGRRLWITRKGAVSARRGELGIIPGSMGARSFIVRGKGNVASYHSCSHGAGRRMSRNEARRRYTNADLGAQTAGVECRKDASVLDELPAAYKDIDTVMAAQADLVEVVHTLKQVLCVKG